MDSKDRRIVAALQADGRATGSRRSGSTCRLRRLEEAGVIRGHTALVDERADGLPVTASVRVRLQPRDSGTVAAFEAAVGRMDAVLDCYVMTGDAGHPLRVPVESLADRERFVRVRLHAMPGIASTDTGFAHGRVKRATVFPPASARRRLWPSADRPDRASVRPPAARRPLPVPSANLARVLRASHERRSRGVGARPEMRRRSRAGRPRGAVKHRDHTRRPVRGQPAQGVRGCKPSPAAGHNRVRGPPAPCTGSVSGGATAARLRSTSSRSAGSPRRRSHAAPPG